MAFDGPSRVSYILKRYPRYSETFIVNEIIAHERVGLKIDIFALKHSEDQHFQDILAKVQAPVRYVPTEGDRYKSFWSVMKACRESLPNFWSSLQGVSDEDGDEVYQAMIIALEATKKGTQHLHAHFASKAATVTRIASRLAGIPYTLTAHAKDIFHEAIILNRVKANLEGAATVITVSDFNVDYLQRVYGIDKMKIRRIYNGLDLSRFHFLSPKDRPSRIVAVGRLVEKKGFPDLIEACALLAQRNVNFECSIIGDGLLESQLRQRIENSGLEEKVRLVGPLPQSEVIQRVQGASVLAAPCVVATDEDKDGLPTVLIEAMALGTPCVSTNVTGIPEIVIDGKTGLTVSQRDPPGLASALETLLNQPALRSNLARRARDHIEKEFDISRNSVQMRDIFQRACREDPRILEGVR